MNKKSKIICIISLIILILCFIGLTAFVIIEKSKEKDLSVDNDFEIEEVEIEKEEDVVVEEVKKVTIIDESSTERPHAVMINTHNAALPQCGLQEAYLVYELMVEGGITRMMALYKDKNIDKIGSVRSARTQYLGYVYENDAIYVHAGGAKDALKRISNEGINDVDVDGMYGMRDTSLNRAWEHTLFTSTYLIKTAMNNRGFRNESNVPNLLTYQAESIDLSSYQSKIIANNVSVEYSYYRTSQYSYDSENKVYLRSMNGTSHTDLITGSQYTFKNIIVYDVTYSTYSYGKKTGYQKIDNIGTGEGYYITEGYAIPIIWEKANEKSQTKYKIKETGTDLIVNDGNTFIQIYPKGRSLIIN